MALYNVVCSKVEFKGLGYTSSYNNVFIIIPAIVISILIGKRSMKRFNKNELYWIWLGFVVYRLVDSLMSKKRQKAEKARLKQQKKNERQSTSQVSPAKKKQRWLYNCLFLTLELFSCFFFVLSQVEFYWNENTCPDIVHTCSVHCAAQWDRSRKEVTQMMSIWQHKITLK